MRAAIGAFRKEYLSAAPARGSLGNQAFGLRDARNLRYAIWWAMYEGNAYDGGEFGQHSWSQGLKADKGLYKYTRPVWNTCYRTAEFHVTHLMGGLIDPEYGDGKTRPSALPIEDADDSVRKALATVARASNWNNARSIWTRNGAVLGDAPLRIVDDPTAGKVYLQPFHPRTLADCDFDDYGNVQRAVIEYERDDPQAPGFSLQDVGRLKTQATYTETIEREGEEITYTTYRNWSEYRWPENEKSTWRVPYGFIPIVVAKHLDVGFDWGFSEFQGAFAKALEADDLGSKIDDQVRKCIEPLWFYAGVTEAEIQFAQKRQAATANSPQPGRQELLTIAAKDSGAKAQPMIADVKIGEASAHLASLLDNHLQDYPELRFDRIRAAGDASAKALREARKPAEAKVLERRARYDDALERAFRMAISIGGWRSYKGYEGFDLNSYDRGQLDFRIGNRPVFNVDPLDRIEQDAAEAAAVGAWVTAGVPLEFALERAGWSPQAIGKAMKAKEAEEERAAQQQRDLMQAEADITSEAMPANGGRQ